MFRKPKRKGKKEGLRKAVSESDQQNELNADVDGDARSGDDEEETSNLISEARKRFKTNTGTSKSGETKASDDKGASATTDTVHAFASSQSEATSNADLATRSALHLPTKEEQAALANKPASGRGSDGIYRVDNKQNKFLAGPLKASQSIRVTSRFDYQPDICKDYKQTGFCGFGDTCIYLHDRGDTMSGWQIEQQYEEQQRLKKEKQEKELSAFLDGSEQTNGASQSPSDPASDDGLPFACHVCREHFKDPIVTTCHHYFCQSCIMDHIRQQQTEAGVAGNSKASCPICRKDTHSVFHEPTKLVAKKRRVLGLAQSKQDDSWKLFAESWSQNKSASEFEGI